MSKEQKLQAVILADSFSRDFTPITFDHSKSMLPLVNVKMIDYVLELLCINNVKEVFIFCVSHCDALESYVSNNTNWEVQFTTLRIIKSPRCNGTGQALRELDDLGIIRSDPFILINGDVVANVNLTKAIEYHKSKRKEDPTMIMTLVLKELDPCSNIKPISDNLLVGINPKTHQIVTFENDLSIESDSLELAPEILKEHESIVFRKDLVDCCIDICSPEVLVQFSDNFDYQDVRRDFIRNEVGNWELGQHIFGYLLEDEYAARVTDVRAYHGVANDLVQKWCHPIVPDAQLAGDSYYIHHGNYVYLDNDANIASSAIIKSSCVIGSGTSIGDSSHLMNAIVGRNVTIGKNVSIVNSHIWDGCNIGDGAKIEGAIVCHNVIIGPQAEIPLGCVLADKVDIAGGVKVTPFCRMTTQLRDPQADNDEGEKNRVNNGVYTITSDEMSGYRFMNIDSIKTTGLDIIKAAASVDCAEVEEWKAAFVRGEVVIGGDANESKEDGVGTEASIQAWLGVGQGLEDDEFITIVADTVLSGHQQRDDAEDIMMEIKSLKFAQNKSFGDCIRGALPPLLVATGFTDISVGINDGNDEKGESSSDSTTLMDIVRAIKQIIGSDDAWGISILKSIVHKEADMTVVIETLERMATLQGTCSRFNLDARATVVAIVLKSLYDEDILSEESILSWNELRADETAGAANDTQQKEKMEIFNHARVQGFIAWLQQEDDDDDDDESSSGSDNGSEDDED